MPHAKELGTALPSDSDEVTHYIFHNYLHLLTKSEWLAYRSVLGELKAQHASPQMAAMLRRSWVSSDPSVQQLLARGPNAVYLAVRDRILAERASDVHLNRCPKCGALARTPAACLCPSCNHTWYELRRERDA